MSQNIYAAAQLALKSRSCAGNVANSSRSLGEVQDLQPGVAGAAGARQLLRERLLGQMSRRAAPAATAPDLGRAGHGERVPCTARGAASLPEDCFPKYRIQRRQNWRGWRKETKGEGGANMGRDIPFPWLGERERSSLVSAQPLLMAGAGKTPSSPFGGPAASAGAWRLCLLAISSLHCSCCSLPVSPCPPSLSPPLSPRERRSRRGRSQAPRSLRCPRAAQAPRPPL